MKEQQWKQLLDVVAGRPVETLPAGLIIDSPWLPGWAGISTLDYFASDELWFEANLKAEQMFPDLWFLPGFWSEYGMCTEPSAFGARCSWHSHELPFAHKIIHSLEEIDRLTAPDPATDGLAPFVLGRLRRCRGRIEQAGHAIRFAVARGPLNVASFLMGATEFLMALRDDTPRIHRLLRIITDYLTSWLDLQIRSFDSIEGILVLDDIAGFCGEPDFKEFARPYLTEMFQAFDLPVRLFHNDADGRVCAGYLESMGVNVFNFSFLHSLAEMRQWAGDRVTLLGNIPPRDVLAQGSPADIETAVRTGLDELTDYRRMIVSCGGGTPDSVSSENIRALLRAARAYPIGTPHP